MGVDMAKVVRRYFYKTGVVLELIDRRFPQAFFSAEQVGRFFIPEPICRGEERVTCVTYVRSIKPADALEKLPLEFPVEIFGFGRETVNFRVGPEFRDGSSVPEELRRISFEAVLCDD